MEVQDIEKTRMHHDIDIIKERVLAICPEVEISQLQVSHPGADDDGIWFFRIHGSKKDIQVESSSYDLPFIIEHSDMKSSSEAIRTASIEETVSVVAAYLAKLKGDPKGSNSAS